MEKNKQNRFISINPQNRNGYLASYTKRKNIVSTGNSTKPSQSQKTLTQKPIYQNALSPSKSSLFTPHHEKIQDISTIIGESTCLSIDSSFFDYRSIFNENLRLKALKKIQNMKTPPFHSPLPNPFPSQAVFKSPKKLLQPPPMPSKPLKPKT